MSEETSNEVSTLKPAFQIDLPSNMTSYYNEFEILFYKQKLTFIFYYKKSDDTFYISFKQNFENSKSNWISNILTYLSSVNISATDDHNKNTSNSNTQIKFNAVNDSKTQYIIYQYISFGNFLKRAISSNKKNFSIEINMKINLINSAINWFIIKNYSKFFKDPNIVKLSKQMITFIIKSKPNCSEQEILISLISWLKDNYNINEDIKDIVEHISWEKISLDLIFEFILTFSAIVENFNLETMFIDVINKKFSGLTEESDNDSKGCLSNHELISLFSQTLLSNFIIIINFIRCK